MGVEGVGRARHATASAATSTTATTNSRLVVSNQKVTQHTSTFNIHLMNLPPGSWLTRRGVESPPSGVCLGRPTCQAQFGVAGTLWPPFGAVPRLMLVPVLYTDLKVACAFWFCGARCRSSRKTRAPLGVSLCLAAHSPEHFGVGSRADAAIGSQGGLCRAQEAPFSGPRIDAPPFLPCPPP